MSSESGITDVSDSTQGRASAPGVGQAPSGASSVNSGPDGARSVDDRSGSAADKSLGELFGDLAQQLSSLIHEEIALAKTELSAKSRRLGTGAGLLGGAGMLAFLALGTLVAAAVAALSQVMSVWLAALIVAAGLLLVAGLVALVGRAEAKRGVPPVPEEALQSTKEDAEWLKSQINTVRR